MLTDWVTKDGKRDPSRALMVFVYDLDRCPDDVVVKVCEAIKRSRELTPDTAKAPQRGRTLEWSSVAGRGEISESVAISASSPARPTTISARYRPGTIDRQHYGHHQPGPWIRELQHESSRCYSIAEADRA